MPPLRKLWAFSLRDWQLAQTYRFTFLFEVVRTLILLLSFYFIGKLVRSSGVHPSLAVYGGDYFRFVLLGIVFSGFMSTALGSVRQTIEFERGHGTLEAILLTPTPLITLVINKTLWDLGMVTAKAVLYLLAGVYFFRVDLSHVYWTSTLVAIALTVSTFFGLGLISAGIHLLIREDSPLDLILEGASRFLGGVYFPVAVLPAPLLALSRWVPLTYALDAIRKSMILGASLQTIRMELLVLAGCSIVLVPIGVICFQSAFKTARRRGILSFE
ncbi:MAG: ABC transporter permease [Elusimicrobiota bacterium]|jgi:ABC-2 type transport system permease protein